MFFTICKRDKQWCAAKKSQWYSICRILTDTALSSSGFCGRQAGTLQCANLKCLARDCRIRAKVQALWRIKAWDTHSRRAHAYDDFFRLLNGILNAYGAHCIQNSDHSDADIGKHGFPHGCDAKCAKREEKRLDYERKNDIFIHDPQRFP